MAAVARLRPEGVVLERLHQLGRSRLVRIVAGQTIGLLERLVLVRLGEVGVFSVVAVSTQRRRVLGQMILGFAVAFIAGLVRDVAGVAAHIERGVAAAALRDIHSLVVAGETKVLLRGRTGRRLQELVLVVGSVRIV